MGLLYGENWLSCAKNCTVAAMEIAYWAKGLGLLDCYIIMGQVLLLLATLPGEDRFCT